MFQTINKYYLYSYHSLSLLFLQRYIIDSLVDWLQCHLLRLDKTLLFFLHLSLSNPFEKLPLKMRARHLHDYHQQKSEKTAQNKYPYKLHKHIFNEVVNIIGFVCYYLRQNDVVYQIDTEGNFGCEVEEFGVEDGSEEGVLYAE